jgi:hypothetical protein
VQTILFLTLSVAGVGLAYMLWVRPWQLSWGASRSELLRTMPGDELVENPSFDATRGITINARPTEIWPWLVQIGIGRAGWYSYDCLDNLCKPSSEKILPEFQGLKIGDLVPLSPDGKQGFWVKELQPRQWMLWTDKLVEASWLWALDPIDEEHTRLITRVRVHYAWLTPRILFHLLIEFADILMMRKCLLGIRQRSERSAYQRRQAQTGVDYASKLHKPDPISTEIVH